MRGQKIGLEIHFQLNTGKLFCRCPVEGHQETGTRFWRTLIPVQSEMGKMDRAAIYERNRSRVFEYIVTDNSCLVEMDEEPPHEVDRKALLTAIAVSRALHCDVLPVISYMRKVVIDGSNTTGFQRTAVVGMDGYIETSQGRVGISTVCLEEDAARKVKEEAGRVTYSLDRLGIPLIEISTEPDIKDEDHAVEVAESIGYIVSYTGSLRRGAEAIRQDVNFSMGHGRVEIKGVSRLSLIREVIRWERGRQENLARAISEWRSRVRGPSRVKLKDVTELFRGTGSRVIANSISSGLHVYASRLDGLSGLLKSGEYRIGRELSEVVKAFGYGGLMHSDELPAFGITGGEVERVRQELGNPDAFMICTSPADNAGNLEAEMNWKLSMLFAMDFSETRAASEDGETRFLRPLPGGERMYPETDVPYIFIGKGMLDEADSMVAPPKHELVRSISGRYGISSQDAEILVNEGMLRAFQYLADETGNPRLISRLLLQTVPEKRKASKAQVSDDDIYGLILSGSRLGWVRDSFEAALDRLFRGEGKESILSDISLRPMGEEELRNLARELASRGVQRKSLVPEARRVSGRPFDPSVLLKLFDEVGGNPSSGAR